MFPPSAEHHFYYTYLFSGVTEEVEQKANQKVEYEEAIDNLKAKNIELRKNKASSAMKAEKLQSKIDHDKNKLGKSFINMMACSSSAGLIFFILL